jgi:WD40 repeat protein
MKFAPSQSIISQTFSGEATALWELFPEIDFRWGPDYLVIEAHEEVHAVAISPDGQLIASGGFDGRVRLWSLSGEHLHTFEWQRGRICSVMFCDQGKQIASVSMHGRVGFWDVSTREYLQHYRLSGFGIAIGLHAISSNGYIAMIDPRKTLWLSGTRTEDKQWFSASTMTFIDEHLDDQVNQPNENVEVASRGRSDEKIEKVLECGSEGGTLFTAVAFSPDGQLAAGTEDGRFMFWALGIAFQPRINKLQSGRIAHIAFGSDGEFATCDDDSFVSIWSYSSAKASSRWQRRFDFDWDALTLGPGGLFVITSGITLTVWDTYADVLVGELNGHFDSIASLAISTKGQVASASSDSTIRLWTTIPVDDKTAGRNIEAAMEHSRVLACALSPDEAMMVSGHTNGEIRKWDTQTGKELQRFAGGHAGKVRAVVFSPNGMIVASASTDGTVRLWNTDTGKELRSLQEHTKHVCAVTFSPDGTLVASGCRDGFLLLWDANTGEMLHRCEGDQFVESLAFSPDGEVVASGHGEWRARLWNAQTGRLLQNWQCTEFFVRQVAVSCNKVVATVSSREWPVQLWDGDSGEPLLELFADDNAPSPGQLGFSLTGDILQTNAGIFHLTDALSSGGTTPSLQPAPLGLNKAGDWIQQYGEDTLWIPSEFRCPDIELYISHRHFLVIPTATRGMVFFRPNT